MLLKQSAGTPKRHACLRPIADIRARIARFRMQLTGCRPLPLFRQLGGYGFGAMLVFLAVLMLGFLYIWKKGGLEWE